MMDYKEKYDAALERARKELQEFKNKDCDDTTRRTVINIVRNLFPELLMESEDERIRKGIIRNLQYLMDRSEGFVKEDLQEKVAWLEKQKEFVSADFDDVWETADCDELIAPLEKYSKDAIKKMCHAWYDKGIELERRNWLNHNPQPKQCEHLENYDKEERIRKGLIKAVSRIFEGYKLFDTDVTREEALAWLEKQGFNKEQTNLPCFTFDDVLALQCCMETVKKVQEDKELYEKLNDLHSKVYDAYQLKKQGEQKPNPYSGTSFEYNGHIWGMCARDNGVEILFDGELKAFLSLEKSFIYPIYPKPDLAHKSAIEVIKDNVDNNNKVKPKFHEGDWVILTAGELSTTLQIVNVDTNKKLYWFNDSSYLPIVDEDCLHLWTINDAKNGDVLSFYLEYKGNKMVQTGIIEKYVGKHGGCSNTFKVYVGVDWENNFQIGEHMGCSDIRPAIKEQQDMLFEKIKNAGYEWNTAKKKLKKIKL